MDWNKIQMKAAALQYRREVKAGAEAQARLMKAEQLAEDLLFQLGTLLGEALDADKSSVTVFMDFPEEIDYETFEASIFGQCPEGFRLKISRMSGYISAHMRTVVCPPSGIVDYVGYDFRDDSYF